MEMKKIVLVFLVMATTMVGCKECTDPSYPILLKNNSQYTLNLLWRSVYPDTTILVEREFLSVSAKTEPGYFGKFNFGKDRVDGWMEHFGVDTLSFFIFDHDVVTNYPWEEIQREYKILQRYDLSLSDLKTLKYELTYPPSSEMRYMKMYPPFEE